MQYNFNGQMQHLSATQTYLFPRSVSDIQTNKTLFLGFLLHFSESTILTGEK